MQPAHTAAHTFSFTCSQHIQLAHHAAHIAHTHSYIATAAHAASHRMPGPLKNILQYNTNTKYCNIIDWSRAVVLQYNWLEMEPILLQYIYILLQYMHICCWNCCWLRVWCDVCVVCGVWLCGLFIIHCLVSSWRTTNRSKYQCN